MHLDPIEMNIDIPSLSTQRKKKKLREKQYERDYYSSMSFGLKFLNCLQCENLC